MGDKMKIYTGYYGKLKSYSNPINIANKKPDWADIPSASFLFPGDWLWEWKKHIKWIDETDVSSIMLGNMYYDAKLEYIRLYNELLKKLTPNYIYEELLKTLQFNEKSVSECTLICYEKYKGTSDLEKLVVDEDFCHRHIIADYLNKNGIECCEKIL